MFFRWCGGCGSKKAGLMNMLEAQNTLVSILNPTVLTWRIATRSQARGVLFGRFSD